MQYFINFYQRSEAQLSPEYHIYRLYSGGSEGEIKKRVMQDLVDEWQKSVDAVKYIEAEGDLRAFVHEIVFLISSSYEIDDYDLEISDPYTNTSDAFDFYHGFLHHRSLKQPYQEVDFYFYGDFLVKIQDLFPYLSDLHMTTGVHISSPMISRISQGL
jgi:hypothetical protein